LTNKNTHFEVFLSHNSKDKLAVELLAKRLEDEATIRPWLDKWNLIPGDPWQEGIEEALNKSRSCAVFIGPSALGPWHNEEMRTALDQRVRENSFRVIPVLLPGANMPERGGLPRFLSRITWVDFRGQNGLNDKEQFHRLVCGIKGIPPGRVYDSSSGTPRIECPYRGLDVFDEPHARFFFGREAMTQHLVERVRHTQFLAILGASGSGKSSLVRAGLLPQLRNGALTESQRWVYVAFKPGAHPLQELALSLAHRLKSADPLTVAQQLIGNFRHDDNGLHLYARLLMQEEPSEAKLFLLVDQFEEIFTLCKDAEERKRFIENLRYAATIDGGPLVTVITMRADFIARATEFTDLAELLSSHQFIVNPMDRDDLLRAIELPAQTVGLRFEDGLGERILNDVDLEPGALPLMEHALWQVFENRKDHLLTLLTYSEIGGVRGALAKRADGIFERFTEAEQLVLRRVMLRLTQPGEGTADTRRRASQKELWTQPEERALVEKVVKVLADERLLTTNRSASGEEQVDVAHEALVRGWPRLSQWINEDREGLRLQHRLSEDAKEWDSRQRDESFLYHGARLAQAIEWRGFNEVSLNGLERAFLDAGIAREKREEVEEKERQQQELETAQQLAETERQRAEDQAKATTRFKRLSSALVGLFLIALITAGFAFHAKHNADYAKNVAEEALSASDFKEAVRLVEENQPREALAYLARAVRTNGDAASSTLGASLLMYGEVPTTLESLFSDTDNATFSANEHWLVTISGNTARAWDVSTGLPVSPVIQHEKTVSSAQFSPDGRWLVTTSLDKTARISDVISGKAIVPPLLHGSEVEAATFSPDGLRVLTSEWDGTARIWDARTGQPISKPMPHDFSLRSIHFSPDGRWVVTVSGNSVRVWNSETGEPISPPMKHQHNVYSAVLNADEHRVNTVSRANVMAYDARSGQPVSSPVNFEDSVEFAELSPDGRLAATISGKAVRVWESATGRPISPPIQHKETVLSVQFSPDERWLMTVDRNKSVQIWDAKTGTSVSSPLRHENFIHAARFSPSGRWILTISDRRARIWHAKIHPAIFQAGIQEESPPRLVSPDKRREIKISNNIAQVWETQTNKTVSPPITHNDYINSAEFSPDGYWMVTASWDKTARVWDTQTGQPVSRPMRHAELLYSARFSPDGRWVVTAAADNTARVWEAKTGLPVSVLIPHENDINSAHFSKDGRWAVIGSKQWEFPILSNPRADYADFLEKIAGYRLNDVGGLETAPGKSRVELRMLLSHSSKFSADARHFLEWLLADEQERNVTPHGAQTTRERIEQLIMQGSLRSLNEAMDAWAENPLALAKLADTDAADLRAPHWAWLALNSGDMAARALAAGLAQQGKLAGITLRESHHTPLQTEYHGTPKEFDPLDMSDTLRQALALMRGDGIAQDLRQGLSLLEQAAKTGEIMARYQLARAISYGAGVPQDEAGACREYLALANSGLPHVQNSLGWCYRNAKLSPQPNYVEARTWYEKAANQGYPPALSNLGSLYQNGQGIKRDWDKARDYYHQAAEKGDNSGALWLAEMIEQGQNGEANLREALAWYRKAAELGNVDGMLAIACRYETGLDLPQSYVEAANWYRRAAYKGNALAQFKLGSLLLEEKIQSAETAAHWFRQAADQGTEAGAFAMGVLFETGTGGVSRDVKQSKHYYKSIFRHPWHDDTDSLQAEAVRRLEILAAAALH
jgi:WD40 repeat protein/TPR repeat protein/energy-coupling factor transporter ATP-binding protein EcfA2